MMCHDEIAFQSASILSVPKKRLHVVDPIGESPMTRGNQKNAVRRNRSTFGPGERCGTEREVELTIRDGMKVLRLAFRGASLVVRYHEGGESDEAFDALRLDAESLTEAAGRLGLGDRSTTALILDSIEREIGLMYDAQTTNRLVQTLHQCFDRPGPRGSRGS
jgi:hypothetical protein